MTALLAAGAKVNGPGLDGCLDGSECVTPLHGATESINVDAVRFLIENGADLEARDDMGRTPLRRMIERRRLVFAADRTELPLRDCETAILDLLIQHGADIEAPDNNGLTPLGFALGPEGNPPFAERLRALGAKL